MIVSVSGSAMEEAGGHQLSPAQLHQLMSVIAGMESVREAGAKPLPRVESMHPLTAS